MNETPKRTRAPATADRLRRDLEGYGSAPLPSIRELSKRYGVSHVTMIRACAILRREGLIRGKQRSGLEYIGTPGDTTRQRPLQPPRRSLDRLCERLSEDIATGRLRSGERLPKVVFYVKEYRVSNHTVLKAYRQLEARGLVYRSGKSWVVGTSKRPKLPLRGENPPVILLIEPRRLFWWRQICHTRTVRFAGTLTEEAERWGVQILSPAATSAVGEPVIEGIGPESIDKSIAELGKRYLGALVAFGSRDGVDPRGIIRRILPFGKPVVWFDRHDEGRLDSVSPRLFTRCHFSEHNAIALAVDHLRQAGHRHIGYLYHDTTSYWRRRRFEDLASAARHREDLVLHGFSQPPGFFDGLYDERFPRFLSRLQSCSLPAVEQALRRLASMLPRCGEWSKLPAKPPRREATVPLEVWERYLDELPPRIPIPRVPPKYIDDAVTVLRTIRGTDVYQHFADLTGSLSLTPAIMKALNEPTITALSAPCDLDARGIFTWLQSSRVGVPERISLLSFDNSPILSGFPITTIDFGFGHLGYTAFHVLFHDVPVKRNRYGEVPTKPHLVHRGSVRRLEK